MKRYGITLIEILIVIVIIAVVAGLLIPVFGRAKRSALESNDLSNLRQLGQAAAIYASDNNEMHPLSIEPLWDSGLVRDKGLIRSKLDHTQSGICFAIASESQVTELQRTDLFSSYPGVRHYGLTRQFFQEEILPASNPGWLVSVASTEFQHGTMTIGLGKYLRLCMDGSVQSRQMNFVGLVLPDSGADETIFHAALYFVDEDGAWLKDRL